MPSERIQGLLVLLAFLLSVSVPAKAIETCEKTFTFPADETYTADCDGFYASSSEFDDYREYYCCSDSDCTASHHSHSCRGKLYYYSQFTGVLNTDSEGVVYEDEDEGETACEVRIYQEGWDYTDNDCCDFGKLVEGTDSYEFIFEDGGGWLGNDCEMDLMVKNSWSTSTSDGTNVLTVRTSIEEYDSSHELEGGFWIEVLDPNNKRCRMGDVRLVSFSYCPSVERDSSAPACMAPGVQENFAIYGIKDDDAEGCFAEWKFDVFWCGDGECQDDAGKYGECAETIENCPEDCAKCKDIGEDSSITGYESYEYYNPEVYGTCTDSSGPNSDTCIDGVNLMEHYCPQGSLTCSNDVVDCKSKYGSDYVCLLGRCTKGCADSDGGKDYKTPGICADTGTTNKDYCKDSTTLVEYYCSAKTCICVYEEFLCSQHLPLLSVLIGHTPGGQIKQR
jgi:hypothetical protein